MVATVFIPSGYSLSIFSDPTLYLSLIIFAASAILAFKKVHPILIICLSAALGILGGYVV